MFIGGNWGYWSEDDYILRFIHIFVYIFVDFELWMNKKWSDTTPLFTSLFDWDNLLLVFWHTRAEQNEEEKKKHNTLIMAHKLWMTGKPAC